MRRSTTLRLADRRKRRWKAQKGITSTIIVHSLRPVSSSDKRSRRIWRLPSIGSTPTSPRRSCSIYAVIFRHQPLDRASYQLRIDGAVRRPFTLSYDELRSMPSETRIATLECAGNSRVFLVPQVQGAQWELGAVSNAQWTGVPLRALLERAGLSENACEIVLEGADRGTAKKRP